MEKIYTIGANRGKKRLWLEGAILEAAGFKPGDRYAVVAGEGLHDNDEKAYLALWPQTNGPRMIAGKGPKPIVDIMSQSLLDQFTSGEKVKVCSDVRGVTVEVVK